VVDGWNTPFGKRVIKMAMINDLEYPEGRWRNLFKAGGVAGVVMLVVMLAQVVVFILWPPPQTVQGFSTYFSRINSWVY
jgi:hypothetical protein